MATPATESRRWWLGPLLWSFAILGGIIIASVMNETAREVVMEGILFRWRGEEGLGGEAVFEAVAGGTGFAFFGFMGLLLLLPIGEKKFIGLGSLKFSLIPQARTSP